MNHDGMIAAKCKCGKTWLSSPQGAVYISTTCLACGDTVSIGGYYPPQTPGGGTLRAV